MEYIKLKDALHIIDLVAEDNTIRRTCKAIRKRLKELPAVDAVEVVRCKGCRLATEDILLEGCYICRMTDRITEADHYCDYGVRKEGAGNE